MLKVDMTLKFWWVFALVKRRREKQEGRHLHFQEDEVGSFLYRNLGAQGTTRVRSSLGFSFASFIPVSELKKLAAWTR